MGHWTVFCAITHAPIGGGDRCVGIWTEPDKYGDPYKPDTPATIFYRGVYHTYGRIDFDKNEKYQELIPKDNDSPDMFILESVFDELDKFNICNHGHSIGDGSAFEQAYISSFNLEKLGFKLQSEKSSDERYKNVYKHESEPNKEIWSDDTWIRLMGEQNEHIYKWQIFKKHFPSIDYSYLLNTTVELNRIDCEYAKYVKEQKIWQKFDTNDDWKSLGNLVEGEFVRNLNITKEMIPFMVDEDFRKRLAKISRVISFMYANNIKFGKRFAGGPQDGNIKAYTKLQHLMRIAKKTILKK